MVDESVANWTREQGVAGSIPGLDQFFFLGSMIVIATGFIHLSPLTIVQAIVIGKVARNFERVLCRVLVKNRVAWIGELVALTKLK